MNNTCIIGDWECDRWDDCPNAGDELHCCSDEEFNCMNGRCILPSDVCNGVIDCTGDSNVEDKSDEMNCERKFIFFY